jgi:predicted naringenin-chalcone synthase
MGRRIDIDKVSPCRGKRQGKTMGATATLVSVWVVHQGGEKVYEGTDLSEALAIRLQHDGTLTRRYLDASPGR